MDRIPEKSVRLFAIEQRQSPHLELSDGLGNSHEGIPERTDKQSHEQPPPVIRAKRGSNGERAGGSEPQQPARAPQIETEDSNRWRG